MTIASVVVQQPTGTLVVLEVGARQVVEVEVPARRTLTITLGRAGYSAYQLAVQEGFVGTVEEWLDSLHGEDGEAGPAPSGTGLVRVVDGVPVDPAVPLTEDEVNTALGFDVAEALDGKPTIYTGGWLELYCATDGDDANDGLTDLTPKTYAGALKLTATIYGNPTGIVRINAAAGDYTAVESAQAITGLLVKGQEATLYIQGWGASAGDTFLPDTDFKWCSLAISNCKMDLPVFRNCYVEWGARAKMVSCLQGTNARLALTLQGNAPSAIYARGGGTLVKITGLTLLGTPHYSNCFVDVDEVAKVYFDGSISITGTATGCRFGIGGGGEIVSSDGTRNINLEYLPGDTMGVFNNAGRFDAFAKYGDVEVAWLPTLSEDDWGTTVMVRDSDGNFTGTPVGGGSTYAMVVWATDNAWHYVNGDARDAFIPVASLPAAAGMSGCRRMVSDANATTFASIVAGGGANKVPVYCDGTNWRIG